MTVLWANNASALLAGAVGLGDTSITLQTGAGALFPSPTGADYFYLTLSNTIALEIVKCTARTGDTLTVVRAQDGTSAISCSIGDKAELRVTRAGLTESVAGAGKLTYSPRTSNTIITIADKASLIDITSGTFTQTFAATASLVAGFYCYIRNSGTGDITLDPNGAETIDGLTSYIMYPNEVRLVQCDGIALRTIVIQPFSKTFTSTANFIKPPGYSQFGGLAWSAGASGARSNSAATRSNGGGGGMCFPFQLSAVMFGTSETITIGAGGTAYTGTSGNTHNPGGTTSIGSILTLPGAQNNQGAGFGIATITPVGFEANSGTNATSFAIYGGGTCQNSTTSNSGPSRFGGGGGGGCDAAGVAYLGGASINGGSGGNASSASNGADGVAPGGGGGATQTGAQSGAGARGEVRIWGLV